MSSAVAVYTGYGLSLTVSVEVAEVWNYCRQTKQNDPERFGVLVGFRIEGTNEYMLELITKPSADDHATRTRFLLQDKSHQHLVDAAFQSSGGTSVYLGTWHTHPESFPTPSSVDKKDWKACIQRNPGRQLFFIIVGTDEIRVYVRRKWRLGFGQLNLKDEVNG